MQSVDATIRREIVSVCDMAKTSNGAARRDGARSMNATVQRIATRDARCAERTALDLQRLEGLRTRYQQRQAVALRQKWFVIGRIIDAAMQSDASLQAAVMDLLANAKLRRDERLCVNLVRE
ncbi:MAG: hypothetical protein AB7G40_05515 [Hyphomonadaceae bacterium]